MKTQEIKREVLSKGDARTHLSIYKDLEGSNDHATCLILLANSYGSIEDVAICVFNRDLRDKLGCVSSCINTIAYGRVSDYYAYLLEDCKTDEE